MTRVAQCDYCSLIFMIMKTFHGANEKSTSVLKSFAFYIFVCRIILDQFSDAKTVLAKSSSKYKSIKAQTINYLETYRVSLLQLHRLLRKLLHYRFRG